MARLISWLLNVVYLTIIAAASPLILWQAFRTGKYREGFREKLLGLVPRREGTATCVWIHAVSVGEVNLIGTLLRELRTAHPDWRFVVSVTSRTGYELARKKYADLIVFYSPLDFSWAVRNAMGRIRPSLLMLAELELWPNLIASAKAYGARVAIINGRLSDHSFPGYRRIRPLVASVLRQIDLIAAQNNETAERFRILGAPANVVHMTGSLKYDGAHTDRSNSRTQSLRELAGISDDDIVFLAGSTQEPEEQYALNIFRRLSPRYPRLRLILVPRHPERFDAVAKLLEGSKLPWTLRSVLAAQPSAELADNKSITLRVPGGTFNQPQALPGVPAPVLLVDTVGELGAWWGTTHIAFVGGSFGSRGGQNMLEPAAYGAAVSFGPNTRNFRDIVAALLTAGGAVVVNDSNAFESFVERCLDEPKFAADLGQQARALVQSNLGATARTISLVEELLRHVPTTRQLTAA